MTSSTGERSSRPARRRWGTLAAGALLVGALALVGLRLLEGVATISLPWGSDCVVSVESGEIGLTLDEARLATTAVALRSRGAESPDTSSIDPDVLHQLAEGPAGDAGPSLSCRVSVADDLEREEPTGTGLTPRAQQLREAMADVFGEQSLGGFAPGGVADGHMAGSTHYDGRAIDVFYRPVTEESRREGWLLAHWLVAHAEELSVQYVIFDDRVWGAHSRRSGWRDYESPDPDNEILRHLDHVHVDVLRGE